MIENANIKKLGMGSLALPIALFAIIFSFTIIKSKSVGQYILGALGIRFPFMIISIALFILAVFIGYKHKSYRYAKIGAKIAIGLLIVCGLLTIVSTIF
ncbi:hypothetical protein [Clostridium sp. Marseille-Q2269]|uniref:hypothetical protein n=1 Tax=Clostridium sp. Marseille-Q2269 TaxID=2942205 RepID=UPI002073DFA0|nr:hypothetical protein [Clostridium sp. Marseille-Q2269]